MYYGRFYSNFIRKNVVNIRNVNVQRSFIINAKEKINRDVVSLTMESCKIKSVKDWSNVRKAILEHEFNRGQYSVHNIDAMIVAHCASTQQFDLGASYIAFLSEQKIKPNLATIGRYLRLIYLKNFERCLDTSKACPKIEEKLIVKYYEDLLKEYPVLDSFTLENIVLALSITSRWRKCLDLLNEIKITTFPSMITYSAVIAAAFLNNEEDLGWTLAEDMITHEKVPMSIAFLAYVQAIKKYNNKEDIAKGLEKLFLFFQENSLLCNEDVAASIAKLRKELGLRSNFTTVSYKGICKSCSQRLDCFDLTDDEFNELKNKVLKNVIVGKDVFIKTNPEELARFGKFIENMQQFDVVLDGLNVGYSTGTKQSTQIFSALVASVVSYFVQQNKTVLVLGRVHMNRWPQQNWGYVKQNATVFLAQDISQDDPYLLYCALNSGKDTIIVTKDLMRSHKFLLKDPKLKVLFNRWLSQRQYQLIRVNKKRVPIFRIPPPFTIAAQCNQGTWHIPYETSVPKDKNEFHRTWLCLKP